jgi:hypothetical protein
MATRSREADSWIERLRTTDRAQQGAVANELAAALRLNNISDDTLSHLVTTPIDAVRCEVAWAISEQGSRVFPLFYDAVLHGLEDEYSLVRYWYVTCLTYIRETDDAAVLALALGLLLDSDPRVRVAVCRSILCVDESVLANATTVNISGLAILKDDPLNRAEEVQTILADVLAGGELSRNDACLLEMEELIRLAVAFRSRDADVLEKAFGSNRPALKLFAVDCLERRLGELASITLSQFEETDGQEASSCARIIGVLGKRIARVVRRKWRRSSGDDQVLRLLRIVCHLEEARAFSLEHLIDYLQSDKKQLSDQATELIHRDLAEWATVNSIIAARRSDLDTLAADQAVDESLRNRLKTTLKAFDGQR